MTAFTDKVTEYAPLVWYDFSQASGSLINQGSLGSGFDLPVNGTPTFSQTGGDNGGSTAISFAGGSSDDGFIGTYPASDNLDGYSEGTILVIFKGGSDGQTDDLYVFSNTADNGWGEMNGEFQAGTAGSRLKMEYSGNGGAATGWSLITDTDADVLDDTWQFIAVVQKDGVDPRMFRDGLEDLDATVSIGASGQDAWFDQAVVYNAGSFDEISIAGTVTTAGTALVREWPGEFDHMIVFSQSLTETQIMELYKLYSEGSYSQLEIEKHLDGFNPDIAIKFQSSRTLHDEGTAETKWAEQGTATYQEGQASDKFYDDSLVPKYWLDCTSSADSWVTTDVGWMSGSSTGTFFFTVSDIGFGDQFSINGFSGGSTTYVLKLERPSISGTDNEMDLTILGAGGAGTDEISITFTNLPQVATGVPLFFALVQDGTGPKLYCNGIPMPVDSETITSGDESMWLHTLSGNVDGMVINGFATWSGAGTFSSAADEPAQHWYNFYYFDGKAFTESEVQDFMRYMWGDNEQLDTALTVSGRNQFRRYWDAQNRGSIPATGIESLAWVIVADGSTADLNHYELWRTGNRWFDVAEIDHITHVYDDGLGDGGDSTWDTQMYGFAMHPDGNVMFGGASGSLTPQVRWYWKDGRWQYATADSLASGSTPQWSWAAWHPDGDLVVATGNQHNATPANPFLYRWDGAGDFEDVSSRMDQTGTRGYNSAFYHICDFSPDGEWMVVITSSNSPYTDIEDAPIHLYEITTTTTDKDTLTWETPYTSGDLAFNTPYSAYLFEAPNGELHLFIGQYAPSSGTLMCVMYKYSGGSWSKDLTLFNNNANPGEFESNGAGALAMACSGSDLYVGTLGAPGTTYYRSFYHFRWNGSYWAFNSYPEYPHETDSPQVAVPVHDIAITPDGEGVIVTTSNTGADDIPVILCYDRDTSNGTLTLRDSTWDFWPDDDSNPGRVYTQDSPTKYYAQNPRRIHMGTSMPTDAF